MKTWRDKEHFKARVLEWANKLGVKTRAVTLRPMRNKWASCSTAGNLNLNAELLELDREIGDYVIVHELLHFSVRSLSNDKTQSNIRWLFINTIRALAMDAVEAAKIRPPGAPHGAGAGRLCAVYPRAQAQPAPQSPGAHQPRPFRALGQPRLALLYSLLHLCGYDLSLDELKRFRQWGSKTPGHPEYRHTPGVEHHDRPPRPGHRQRRRHGDRRATPGSAFQPQGAEDRRPLHLCLLR